MMTFSWLQIQKIQLRRRIKAEIIAGIDKSELVLLKITPTSAKEIHWEHDGEFSFRQQMYDIVESSIKGDTTYYWCWLDTKENKLNKLLGELLAQALGKNSRSSKTMKQLWQFFKTVYFSAYSPKEFFPYKINEIIFHYAFTYQGIAHAPPSPPPQFV